MRPSEPASTDAEPLIVPSAAGFAVIALVVMGTLQMSSSAIAVDVLKMVVQVYLNDSWRELGFVEMEIDMPLETCLFDDQS